MARNTLSLRKNTPKCFVMSCRSQDFTLGRQIEAPKVPSFERRMRRVGWRIGRGYRLPSRLGGLGERRELPQRGPGQSPVRQRIFGIFEVHRTVLVEKTVLLY